MLERARLNLITKKDPKTGKSNGILIYPTYKLFKDVFLDQFGTLLDEMKIKHRYNGSERVILTDLGKISVFTMQRPELIVGTGNTFALIDEFDTENYRKCELTWNKAIARIRGMKGAQLALATTPEGFHYTYHQFVEKKSPSKLLIQVKSTDNPYLDQGYIDSLYEQYDDRLVRQYLNGEFVPMNSGQIYYQYDPERHQKAFTGNIPDAIYVGMDFNRTPMTAILAEVDIQARQMHCFDEFYLKDSNTREMAIAIREKYPTQMIHIYPDATGRKGSSNAELGVTDLSILREPQFGFKVHARPSNYNIIDRYATVNRFLKDGNGITSIWFDPSLNSIDKDLRQVVYKGDTRKPDESNRGLVHISDALGYLIVGVFGISIFRNRTVQMYDKDYFKDMRKASAYGGVII